MGMAVKIRGMKVKNGYEGFAVTLALTAAAGIIQELTSSELYVKHKQNCR